jgi:hypothetical protein
MKKNVPADRRVTKRKRMMTDKESSDLLESAREAVAFVRGSKSRWRTDKHA